MSFVTELRTLPAPAPDADRMAQWDAARALAEAYAKDVGLPICQPYRDLALERVRHPDRPSLPKRPGWSAWWPHLEDEPGWEQNWARDDALRRGQERMTVEIHARKAAEEAERQRVANEAEQANTVAAYDEQVAGLRRRYLSVPGTTETDFQAVLPRLIEDERLRLMKEHQSFEDEALALARRRIQQRL